MASAGRYIAPRTACRHVGIFLACVVAVDVAMGFAGRYAVDNYTDMSAVDFRRHQIESLDFKPQVLFWGDSRVHEGISPAHFTELTGLSSYDYAVGGSTPYAGKRLYEDCADTVFSDVRYVLIGLTDSVFNRRRVTNIYGVEGVNTFDHYLLTFRDRVRYAPRTIPSSCSNIFRYRRAIRGALGPLFRGEPSMRPKIEEWLNADDEYGWQNSRMESTVYPSEEELAEFVASQDWFTVAPDESLYTVRALEDFVEILKEHGITPILVNLPYHPDILRAGRTMFGREIEAYDRLYERIAETHGIVFINDRDPLPEFEGYGDDLHMMRSAAILYSQHLAREFNRIVATTPAR